MNLRSFFLVSILVLAASSLVASDRSRGISFDDRPHGISHGWTSRWVLPAPAPVISFLCEAACAEGPDARYPISALHPGVSTASGRPDSEPIDWAVSQSRDSHKFLLKAGGFSITIDTSACTRALPEDDDKVMAAYKKLSSTYQRLRAPLNIIFLSSAYTLRLEWREYFIIIVTKVKLPSGAEKKAFHIFTSAGKDIGRLPPRNLIGALRGIISQDSGVPKIHLTSCIGEGPELDTFLAVLMSKQE